MSGFVGQDSADFGHDLGRLLIVGYPLAAI